MSVVRVRSGAMIDLQSPEGAEFLPSDIAHSLAHLCRYNGHVSQFYSVADHSLRVADIVSPENKLTALMHDATEAYLGDMVRPLKQIMPDYRALEGRLWRAIAQRFGMPAEIPQEVHDADEAVGRAEWRDLVVGHKAPLLIPRSPLQSACDFLEMFNLLTGGLER